MRILRFGLLLVVAAATVAFVFRFPHLDQIFAIGFAAILAISAVRMALDKSTTISNIVVVCILVGLAVVAVVLRLDRDWLVALLAIAVTIMIFNRAIAFPIATGGTRQDLERAPLWKVYVGVLAPIPLALAALVVIALGGAQVPPSMLALLLWLATTLIVCGYLIWRGNEKGALLLSVPALFVSIALVVQALPEGPKILERMYVILGGLIVSFTAFQIARPLVFRSLR